MGGEKSSSERADRFDAELDGFERECGLPSSLGAESRSESSRLLSLPPTFLAKMSASECGEGSYVLSQFALHLQRAANREQARARWAEESVKRMVAPRLGMVQGYGYQERHLMALRESDAAMKVDEIRVRSLTRLDRIAYLSSKVERMARALADLQQSKRGKHD